MEESRYFGIGGLKPSLELDFLPPDKVGGYSCHGGRRDSPLG